MNELQEKSLKLIEEFFSNMDGVAFLQEHEALEKNVGPTLEFFLDSLKNNHYSSFIKMKSKSLTMPKNFKIKERSYPSFDEKRNDCYAANDEIYPIRLAA